MTDAPTQIANTLAAPVVALAKLPMTIINSVIEGGQSVTDQMRLSNAPRQLMMQTAELLRAPLAPLEQLARGGQVHPPRVLQNLAQGGETYRAPGLPPRVVKQNQAKQGQLTQSPTGRTILTHIF